MKKMTGHVCYLSASIVKVNIKIERHKPPAIIFGVSVIQTFKFSSQNLFFPLLIVSFCAAGLHLALREFIDFGHLGEPLIK